MAGTAAAARDRAGGGGGAGSSAASSAVLGDGAARRKKERRPACLRSRHRLLSICRDARDLGLRVLSALAEDRAFGRAAQAWPWLPNQRCGSWYLPPDADDGGGLPDVYFKSTDGHVGTYAVSLKRLNLPLLGLLRDVGRRRGGAGGCFLVDSSARKILPDSFSRTIPMWCCAMNRLVLRYRAELLSSRSGDGGGGDDYGGDWDTRLHTPSPVVSPEEHAEMSDHVDSRVEALYRSGAIVDPARLVNVMTRPIRAIWVANGSAMQDTIPSHRHASSHGIHDADDEYSIIVCCNPSYYDVNGGKNHVRRMKIGDDEDDDDDDDDDASPDRWYHYAPGAADDDATWGRNLTPELFWSNRDALLRPSMTDDETDAAIDSVVNERRLRQRAADGNDDELTSSSTADRIGSTNIWVGSRRSGRPPMCWEKFDAILNVTENEYPNMLHSIEEEDGTDDAHPGAARARHYIQLPVEEGKRDRSELERWMPVGLVFLAHHLQRGARVLVHCAQGRDRSVAIAMAFVALFCPPSYPPRLKPGFETLRFGCMADSSELVEGDNLYLRSGLCQSLVNMLLQDGGKDLFLASMHKQLKVPATESFADKDSLRIALHLVRQDRENAEPTRSTMKKLNRFFCSGSLYRTLK